LDLLLAVGRFREFNFAVQHELYDRQENPMELVNLWDDLKFAATKVDKI